MRRDSIGADPRRRRRAGRPVGRHTRPDGLDGYEVVAAEDGPAALGAVHRERPELVVLDVLMPELDGVAVCRRLRGDGDRTPILMLTARDAVSDRVAGAPRGGISASSS